MSSFRLRGMAILVSIVGVLLLLGAKPPKSKKIPPGVKELAIGAKAPDFKLIGTDDKLHALSDVQGDKGTLIIFTCNHCPFAIKYEDRIIALAGEYQKKGIGVAAISCNDVGSFADDSFPKMKIRAKEKGFNFPYLYDESQAVALEYGPMVTPHIFLFDSELALVYRGRIDDSAKEDDVKKRELTDALNALIAGDEIGVDVTKAFGCSIKWKPEVLASGKPHKSGKQGR